MSWLVEHHRGGAHELHHLEPADDRRRVLVMGLDHPAVALGSTQTESVLDPAAVARSGRVVTRRHSGGGLVVLDPGDALWVDVVIPAGDALWRHDVGEAFIWLGEAWASALGSPTSPAGAPTVHRGRPVEADLGRVVCFAGIGIGEVVVEGRKAVGLSQRRTRAFSRFQCLVHRRFDAEGTVALLAPGVRSADGEALRQRLDASVAVVDDLAGLLDAFLGALNRI